MDFGMPNFEGLTEKIINEFKPPEESEILSAFSTWDNTSQYPYKVPFDQVFHLLYQEYPRREVNQEIEKIFETDLSKISKNHETIRRISSNTDGIPQIVTTNFDRLFERDNEKLKIHEPPALPNLKHGGSISGITYLHGRLNGDNIEEYPYVLGSSDFGRAYLAEGWATDFIRSLLEMYTVVLVGYSADDPPVKYLLQGLNHNKRKARSHLFVFDRGEPEKVEAKWADKGVTSIAYADHPQLWETLEAWAKRAEDPSAWRNNIIEKARTLPHLLDPHERGQVAHLVKTSPGAKEFANAKPPLPADWLWVFDSTYRTKDIIKNYITEEEFDPLKNYGLDDDLPRDENSKNGDKKSSLNLLQRLPTDENQPESNHLVNFNPSGSESLPSRLFHLSRWILSSLNDPITLDWASREQRLHPNLTREIQQNLNFNNTIPKKIKQLWSLVLLYQESRSTQKNNQWIFFNNNIRNEGWSHSALREIDEITKPRLNIINFSIHQPTPLTLKDEIHNTNEKLPYEVFFTSFHGNETNIPDIYLSDVVFIINNNLKKASSLHKELENKNNFYNNISCYDVFNPHKSQDPSNHKLLFLWFIDLFKKLIEIDPTLSKSIANTWSESDIYFFGKLKLFSLNQRTLFSPAEVGKNILDLPQETFWDYRNQKEILFLINVRWEELSQTNRNKIINRILQGPSDKEASSNSEDNLTSICKYARWLQLQGKKFTSQQEKKLIRLISSIKGWEDSWASGFLESGQRRSGLIGTNESPERIIHLPDNEVIAETQRLTVTFPNYDVMTEIRPFIGLVKENPKKALSALILESKKENYPLDLWTNLLEYWPNETDPEQSVFLLQTTSKLPEKSIRNLSHITGRWVEHNIETCHKISPEQSLTYFDELICAINSQNGSANRSGIGDTYLFGKKKKTSQKTYEHARNGPIGEFTIGLLKSIDSLKLETNQGIPHQFKTRLEILTKSPNEGGFHAVTILAYNLSWINHIDPKWTKEIVFPWFDFTHKNSEAAWHGFFSNPRFSDSIGMELKPYLPNLFPKIYTWNPADETTRRAAQIIIHFSTIWKDDPGGLDSDQAMNSIRQMKEAARISAVQALRCIVKEEDDWKNYVIPFIKSTWPKDMSLRTSKLTDGWFMLLTYSGNAFPDLLKSVKRFLLPISTDVHYHNFDLFMRKDEVENSLTKKFPYEVLELLDVMIPEKVSAIPYQLQNILNLMIETKPKIVEKQAYKRLIRLIEQA
ncbi:MAG: SIR2 family protein [Opitutales bacterium]|nr:SIR2 family protein [Opitutales bacterium]